MSDRRFSAFRIGELQQLMAGAVAVIHLELIAPGPGNLLPGLVNELEEELQRKIAEENTTQ